MSEMTDEQVQSFKPDGICWAQGSASVCLLVEGHDGKHGWEICGKCGSTGYVVDPVSRTIAEESGSPAKIVPCDEESCTAKRTAAGA